jgi:hypothetical protein
MVQRLPSSHSAPSDLGGVVQMPVTRLHVPASWHWSRATHTTGLLPVQVPFWQASVRVQPSPSLQVAPFGLAGLEHSPVDVSQVPAT